MRIQQAQFEPARAYIMSGEPHVTRPREREPRATDFQVYEHEFEFAQGSQWGEVVLHLSSERNKARCLQRDLRRLGATRRVTARSIYG